MLFFYYFCSFMKWLDSYRKSLLNKQAAKVTRTVRLCDPDNISRIGILWMESDEKAYKYLYDYFKSPQVLVRYLCFTYDKEVKDSNMITPKDINWLGYPKTEQFHKFLQTEFDLLLNISVTPNFPLQVMTTLSRAKLKMGWDNGNPGLFDISIDVSNQPDAMFLAEQQIFYLKQFNKNNSL